MERPQYSDLMAVAAWMVMVAAFMVLVGLLLWVASWVLAPLNASSPERVERLSAQANEMWAALEAQRADIELQEGRLAEFVTLYGEDRGTWPQGKRQEYEQLAAARRNLVASYNHACGRYNALYEDEWRSVVAPQDLPGRCELVR